MSSEYGDQRMNPPEYRIAYRIMKNSGQDPSEGDLLKQMRALKDEARGLTSDPQKSERFSKLMNYKEAEIRAKKKRKG